MANLIAAYIYVMAVLQLMFALCVWVDADRLFRQGKTIVILPPFVWGLASLLLGLFAVAFYWLCHYSRMGRRDI